MERILVIHPEVATRRSVELTVRRACVEPASIYEAASLAEGLRRSRHLEPNVILIDLSEDPALALEVVRELRRPDRLIVGLYNPLVLPLKDAEFFRRAARAGVGDFVPLPASEAELGEALAAAPAVSERSAGGEEGRLITFFTHKGGVGTTTLAVHTALALAGSGEVPRGVVLCDAVMQLGTAAALLGLAPEHDLIDAVRLLDDPGAMTASLSRHEPTGLRVLASPRDPRQAEEVSPEDLGRILIHLRRRFGLVLVDTPSALDWWTLTVLDLSDAVWIVTEAVAPTLAATARLLGLLEEQGFTAERIRVVLNRYGSSKADLPSRAVTDLLGRAVDQVVAYDESVRVAANRGVPLVPGRNETEFIRALRELADELLHPLAVES